MSKEVNIQKVINELVKMGHDRFLLMAMSNSHVIQLMIKIKQEELQKLITLKNKEKEFEEKRNEFSAKNKKARNKESG